MEKIRDILKVGAWWLVIAMGVTALQYMSRILQINDWIDSDTQYGLELIARIAFWADCISFLIFLLNNFINDVLSFLGNLIDGTRAIWAKLKPR